MKKIIFISTLGMLFSCSSETASSQTSEDAKIIKLMKTEDKNTLSQADLRAIVDYLDKRPEDSKYLRPSGTYIPVRNLSSKNSDKKKNYTMEDYMQIQIVPPNSPDYNASVEIIKLKDNDSN